MKLPEIPIRLTVEDVAFVGVALQHYRLFAEAAERQGEDGTAGKMRSQEFYAERFKARIDAAITEAQDEPVGGSGS